MIDKNAMALFVQVVENNGFSRAARREGVPVSTVSRKIMDLEKALDVRLLDVPRPGHPERVQPPVDPRVRLRQPGLVGPRDHGTLARASGSTGPGRGPLP